jgi:hypothetical protein
MQPYVIRPILPLPPAPSPRAIVAHAARLWARRALVFTLLCAVEWGPAQVLMAVGLGAGAPLRALLLVNLFLVVAGALIDGAVTYGLLREAAGQRPGPLQLLGVASERFGRLLAVSAVCGGLQLGGLFLLLGTPALYLVFRALTFVAIPVALAESELPVLEVFRRTLELSRGRRLWLFVVVTALFGVEEIPPLALEALAGAPAAHSWAIPAAKAAWSALAGGLGLALSASVYLALAASPPRAD